MSFKSTLAASAAALALAGGFAAAQETTGAIRGTVTDDAGMPLSGATIIVADEATGQSRTTTTDSNGRFQVRNLAVTGDYSVSVRATGFDTERVDDVDVYIGDTTTLSFDLAAGATDTIVVVGTAATLGADLAKGPSAAFGLETLETAPAINRDIKDVIRIDPRVYLDETFAESISCAGANPRFNSLTVDGIRLNDNFGLNSNGYPTERMPFPYDAIDQVAVELAPFDVEYGSFTACNINAVTKSGTNEFHGGAFYDYTSDSLRGDEADGLEIDNGDFDEYRYGLSLQGPIIKDMLFFSVAYEKLEGADLFGDVTPEGKDITEAQWQEIVDIAQDVYGYEVGGLPTSLDFEDEKFLAKIDWNIVDGHRASFTYNYNEGYSNSPSDNDPDELPEYNHFYKRGATLNSYAGSLYSNWTDALSTEIRISYIDLENIQDPLAGLDQWGQVEIDVDQGDGDETTVYLGADDSRHANELNYELWTYKAKADYAIGDHVITAGIEREEFEVFNQFVQEVKGEWGFNSIEDFRNGDFNDFRYQNAAGTNNPDDGAAAFGYEITSVYLQDDWRVSDRLDVVAGLRWDYFTSGDKPAYNPDFHATYGFRNDDNLEGKSVVQPRVAFTYDYNDDLTFRGGAGLFSGGNPNVWISNNYSNNGVTLFAWEVDDANVADFTYDDSRGVFFDVPTEGKQAVAAAQGGGSVNALDPDFEIPSEWKYNLGLTWNFDAAYDVLGDGYELNFDLLYAKVNEAAIVKPIGYIRTGTAPDGRPIYGAGNDDDFVLTNADDKGQTFVASASLSKSYDFGLDWTLGYAYTDAQDTNPMTSSVAFSNFANVTRSDALNLTSATSDYEIAHRFTMKVDYEREFVANYATHFALFGEVAEGSPYSFTYGNPPYANPFEGAGYVSNALLYVPTGPSDPRVASAPAGFYEFINSEDCLSDSRGEIIDRNSCADEWYSKFDLKITQDLPGVFENDRTQAFVVVENLANFLNSDWGVRRQQGFPGAVNVVDASINGDGQYVYSNFRGDGLEDGSIQVDQSLWEIRFGIKYDF